MPAPDAPLPGLMPSVFDRLTDPASMGTAAAPGATLAAVVEAVRRDVEDLLNARRPLDPELDRYPELSRSAFNYGLAELTSRAALSGRELEAIGRMIAETVARHEPRLRDVRATLLSKADGIGRALHFRVEGRLRVEPAPGVEFEAVLETSTGQTSVLSKGA